jgi:hypothetical protein
MSFNRNTYIKLGNYNNKENFVNSNYETQKTSYPKDIKVKQSGILSNYNSSGIVSTNPAYNVGVESPGLSWN